MLPVRLAAALTLIALLSASAIEREPADVYRERRHELARSHPDGVILLFGYGEKEAQSPRSHFYQESNFYYLTGWDEPGAALLLVPPKPPDHAYREVLFLPPVNPAAARWTGARTHAGTPDAGLKTGFDEVSEEAALFSTVEAALGVHPKLYSLLWKASSYGQQPEPDRRDRLRQLTPEHEPLDLRPTLTRMRSIKSASEIALIQKAVDATAAAHRRAWTNVRPGRFEYQIMAPMLAEMISRGCLRPAYPPIIGSGPNATVLHYIRTSRRLEPGELVLMDVGGEYAHYAADITRTVPVSGEFSSRQRKIYELVLGAQQAVIGAVKPGMKLGGHGRASLHQLAMQYFEKHGRGVLDGAVANLFPHGIGHHVGLEVHDPAGPGVPLEPGMVITVEPGLYFSEEGLGVRIEDMVLVTPGGARVLSESLPRTVHEIERAMRK